MAIDPPAALNLSGRGFDYIGMDPKTAPMLKEMLKDHDAPAMKPLIAVTGYGGRDRAYGPHDTKEAVDQVIAAQYAIPKRPEFKDAAVTVETRDFYRPQDPLGGNKQGIHWHANGDSYWLVGEAMGRGMLRLLPAKPTKPQARS